MRHVELQASLLTLLSQARKAELAWMSDLSEGEAEGTRERWSAKNLLAHIAAWKERGIERLNALARGEVPLL